MSYRIIAGRASRGNRPGRSGQSKLFADGLRERFDRKITQIQGGALRCLFKRQAFSESAADKDTGFCRHIESGIFHGLTSRG